MAIPKELKFENEDDFTQRFLIPLLHRLGFSVVANYHRSHGEFGKDLVFGEIDRFGHVRYYGLQSKYEGSIGLAAVETVVQDCRQAFANPFKHPHTHAEERIQSFYAVNAGSFSDDARQQFFNSVGQPLATCSRLLDGQSLLALDKWATANRSTTALPELNGLLMEIYYNRQVAHVITPRLEQVVKDGGRGGVSANRFRVGASAQYLHRPMLAQALPPEEVEKYWENIELANRLLNECVGIITVDVVLANATALLRGLPKITQLGEELASNILKLMHTMGPLASL